MNEGAVAVKEGIVNATERLTAMAEELDKNMSYFKI